MDINQVLNAGGYLSGHESSSLKSKSAHGGKDGENAEFKKIAKDMESLFAYQMLKVMRQTSESISTEEKGAGYSTYMGMFDMELSKLLADRGLGLQDAIINWLERMPEENKK